MKFNTSKLPSLLKTAFNGFLWLLIMGSCREYSGYEKYNPFNDHTWHRFDLLKFEIPVQPGNHTYKVVFFARHTQDFPYKTLNINMIMNTPSGEERINEYHLVIKKESGKFFGKCVGDTCEASLVLKNELTIQQDGILTIELENLTPRLETPGLLGVGIRLIRNG